MPRRAYVMLMALLLVACQPGSPIEAPTSTALPPTPTSTQISPTDTPAPPTATQIPPTEPVILDFERTGAMLLIIGSHFDAVEFSGTQSTFLRAGYEVVVGAFTLNPLPDNRGGPGQKPDILLSDVRVEDFDAIVFIGGGAMGYLNDPEAHRIAQETVEQGRVLAAICHGPLVLAKAGVLEGRRATAYFGTDSDECRKLQRDGAICTYANVEQDGLIITGRDPSATGAFAGAILRLLQGP
ncbi:MAG: DJ-1/PfpI family protein [Anaerolineales bacterium]